jgi:hypothetical protein
MRGDHTAQEPGIRMALVKLEDRQAVLMSFAQLALPHSGLGGAVVVTDLWFAGAHDALILSAGAVFVICFG